jgi:uncharacterized lipoprotein YajG
MTHSRSGPLVIIVGVLLLAGCQRGAPSYSPAATTPPSPAATAAPQLDEVESTLNRIERELDSDAER